MQTYNSRWIARIMLLLCPLVLTASMCELPEPPGQSIDNIKLNMDVDENTCGSAINASDWSTKGELRADADDRAYWVTQDNQVVRGERDDTKFSFDQDQAILWRPAAGNDPGCVLTRRDMLELNFDAEKSSHWSGTNSVHYSSPIGCAIDVGPGDGQFAVLPCSVSFEVVGKGEIHELPDITDAP